MSNTSNRASDGLDCWTHRGEVRASRRAAGRKISNPQWDKDFVRQSERHYLRNAWAQAAQTQQVKIIPTYGSLRTEVNTEYFHSPEYVPLISTAENFSAGEMPEELYPTWPFGFILAKDFLAAHGEQFSAPTRLALKAREMARIAAPAAIPA